MTVQARATFEGVWNVLNKLDQIEEIFLSAVKDTETTIYNEILQRTPLGTKTAKSPPGYKPGNLAKSWGKVQEVRGGFTFENPASYAEIIEYGLYERVSGSGRTERGPDGKIYSSQAVGGMLRPLVKDPDVIRRILEDLVKAIMREIGKGVGA